MDATVIDTLRFANRLKAAGFQGRQAEAMSRAINDELAGGVATKDDLARAVVELKAELAKVDAKVDGNFDSLNEKLDALDGKFESQGRHVFLVLALIAALGLYSATAPHFTNQEPRLPGANASETDGRTERPGTAP